MADRGVGIQAVVNTYELILPLLAVPLFKHDAQDVRMRVIFIAPNFDCLNSCRLSM